MDLIETMAEIAATLRYFFYARLPPYTHTRLHCALNASALHPKNSPIGAYELAPSLHSVLYYDTM
jgi:hypothetical protein